MPIDPAKTKARAAWKHAGTFYSLCLDEGSARLFAGGDDATVSVFNLGQLARGPLARWTKHDNYVSALEFVPTLPKPVVLSASYDRHVIWWDAMTGQPIRAVEAHAGWVRALAVLPEGSRVASAGDDMQVRLWETASGRLIASFVGHARQTPQGHVSALYGLAVSPDGRHLASGDRAGVVCIWETETGKLSQRFEIPALYTYDARQRQRSIGGIRALAFSPDGDLLAAGGIGPVGNVDGLGGPAHVEVCDWRTPQHRFTAEAQGHRAILNTLVFHPREPWLIGGGGGTDGGVLAFWRIDKARELLGGAHEPLAGQRIKTEGHIHNCRLHPRNGELFTAGYRKLEAWQLGS
jgi:WD40 repeat protein